jgi:spore coat polysaccharide biosynthesis protein SpsF
MDILVIIQCRFGSSRLLGKCALPLAGESMLYHVIERSKKIKADGIIVATTKNKEDDWVEKEAKENDVLCRRFDDPDDVLGRFCNIVNDLNPSYVVRITADNPLFDYNRTNKMLEDKGPYMYMDYPVNGLRSEIIRSSAIRFINEKVKTDYDREHVTSFLRKEESISKLIYFVDWLKYLRLTVDTKDDYRRMVDIYDELYRGYPIPVSEVLEWLGS